MSTIETSTGTDGTYVSPTMGVYKESFTWVLDATTYMPVGVRKDTTVG